MIDKENLCEQIRSIYPEVGECGIGVDVDYDRDKEAWVVDLKAGGHRLKTHLEPGDAEACVRGEKCFHLGAQIGQLVDNIKND
jgi:hypothetical protein